MCRFIKRLHVTMEASYDQINQESVITIQILFNSTRFCKQFLRVWRSIIVWTRWLDKSINNVSRSSDKRRHWKQGKSNNAQRIRILFLLKSIEIRLYLLYSGTFWTNQNLVWFHMNRKIRNHGYLAGPITYRGVIFSSKSFHSYIILPTIFLLFCNQPEFHSV